MAYITTSNYEEAKRIGEEMVKLRMAACANIIKDMHSIYWWNGKMEEAQEAVLILKSRIEMLDKIMKKVEECHSYENPCVVAIPIKAGRKEYLKWIDKEIKL